MVKGKKSSINPKQKVIATIMAIVIVVVIAAIIVLTIIRTLNYDKNEPINENFAFLIEEESEKLENFDIYNSQNKIIKELLDDYSKNKYTIDNPKMVHNPFLNSPLSALIMFKTNKKEMVTLTIKGKHDDDLVTTFEASKDHFIPVYGLYERYNNEIIVTTESGKSHTLYLKLDQMLETGAREVIIPNNTNSNGEFFFGTTAVGTASIAYDYYGEVRWFLSEDYSKGMTMLQNGHILLCDLTEGPNTVSTGGVIEIDMLGFIHRQYEFEGGYHHDGLELKNGNLIILSSDPDSDTVADIVIEVDRKTGEIVKTWDLKKTVVAIDDKLIDYGEITWGWMNGVTYDEDNNELILSMRNRNSIVAIDYDTGNIKWILGEKQFWSKKFDKYLITGIGSDFIYPRGQHSPLINKKGNLTIFNNGYNAYKEKTIKCSSIKYNESYAIEYVIDRENKTARILYKFGGRDYFSYALSSYNYSYNGHPIFNSGWHFASDELYDDPNCTQYSNDKYNSFIIEFNEKNEKIFEMKVDESKFEVVKAPIYNLEAASVSGKVNKIISNYEFDTNSSFTSSKTTSKYTILSEAEAAQYVNNTPNSTALFLMNNRLQFEGSAPIDMEISATVISPKGAAYKFVLKEEGSEEILKADLNSLPKGRYYIFVTVDNTVYNTKYFIELD